MKLLISTFVTFAVGSALAATSTSVSTPTSVAKLEEVKPSKSPLSLKMEAYVEKSQADIDAGNGNLTNENDIKATYKLSDKEAVRVMGQIVNKMVDTGDTESQTRIGKSYLQYSHSSIGNIGDQALDLAVRAYIPTDVGSKNNGLNNQTRIYLSSDFKINERLTVTPYLNPRFFFGSGKYEDKDSNLEYLMVSLVEASMTFNDRLSWVTDIARFDKGFQNGDTADTFYLETWLTANLVERTAITQKIALDLGFYNENSGNGIRLNGNANTYFTRLHVNF